MRLVRHLCDLPYRDLQDGSVVTIGSFDGLHLGHQRLLESVKEKSLSDGVPSIVMSFEPTPSEYFSASNPPARLMRFREKFEALAKYDIDLFFCPRFGPAMRDLRAGSFIRRILVHGLNARHLVVGDDFKFGHNREGNVGQLLRCARALDYSVEQVPSIVEGRRRVSSTAIRELLRSGDLDGAAELLGRPYRMSGRIVLGRQVGRKLGMPTANVNVQRLQTAVQGIFAVRVSGLEEGVLDGVASLGTRPTFGLVIPILEVHILDFDREIYGEHIQVDFIAHLRGEENFDAIDELVAQMNRDAENARSILAAYAD